MPDEVAYEISPENALAVAQLLAGHPSATLMEKRQIVASALRSMREQAAKTNAAGT